MRDFVAKSWLAFAKLPTSKSDSLGKRKNGIIRSVLQMLPVVDSGEMNSGVTTVKHIFTLFYCSL